MLESEAERIESESWDDLEPWDYDAMVDRDEQESTHSHDCHSCDRYWDCFDPDCAEDDWWDCPDCREAQEHREAMASLKP